MILLWLYLAGMGKYRAKMKGKMSQKLKELKGILLLLSYQKSLCFGFQ